MFPDINITKTKIVQFIDALKKDKKMSLILIASLVMISFLVAGEFSSDNKSDYEPDIPEYESDYIDKSEIEDFLENVCGAGEVKIMITYDSSEEYIYAKDTNENTRDKNNSDNEINYKSEHIIIKEDGNEKGLMIKEIYPEIRGIAVICDGGNDPIIKAQMVDILSALFGINTNRISVAAKSG